MDGSTKEQFVASWFARNGSGPERLLASCVQCQHEFELTPERAFVQERSKATNGGDEVTMLLLSSCPHCSKIHKLATCRFIARA
jgi:hypothetical protein